MFSSPTASATRTAQDQVVLDASVVAAVSVIAEISCDLEAGVDGCFTRSLAVVLDKRRSLLSLSQIGCTFPSFLHVPPTDRPPLTWFCQDRCVDCSPSSTRKPSRDDLIALEHALYGCCFRAVECAGAAFDHGRHLRRANDRGAATPGFVLNWDDAQVALAWCRRRSCPVTQLEHGGQGGEKSDSAQLSYRLFRIGEAVCSYLVYLDSIVLNLYECRREKSEEVTPTSTECQSPVSMGSSGTDEVNIALFMSSNCEASTLKCGRSDRGGKSADLVKTIRREREKRKDNIVLRDIARHAATEMSRSLAQKERELLRIGKRPKMCDAYSNGFVDWFGRIVKGKSRSGKGSFGVVIELGLQCAKLSTQFLKSTDHRSFKRTTTTRVTIPEAASKGGGAVQEALQEAMVSSILCQRFGESTLRRNLIPSTPLTMPIGILMPKALCDVQFVASFMRRARAATSVIVEVLVRLLSYQEGLGDTIALDGHLSLCAELFKLNGPGIPTLALGWPEQSIGGRSMKDTPALTAQASLSLSCVWDFTSLTSLLCSLGYWLRRGVNSCEGDKGLTCVDVERERMSSFLQFCFQSLQGMLSLMEVGLIQCDCSLSNFVVFDSDAEAINRANNGVEADIDSCPKSWMHVAICDLGAVRQVGVEQLKTGRTPTKEVSPAGRDTHSFAVSDLTTEMRRSNPVGICPNLIQSWTDNSPYTATEKCAVNSFGAMAEDFLRSAYGVANTSAIRRQVTAISGTRTSFLAKLRKFKRQAEDLTVSYDHPVMRLTNWRTALSRKGNNQSRTSLDRTKLAGAYCEELQRQKSGRGRYGDHRSSTADVLCFMEEEFAYNVKEVPEEMKLSSFHRTLIEMRGMDGIEKYLRHLGRFFKSKSMLGASFPTTEEGQLKMKLEARDRFTPPQSSADWDTYQLISLIELSYGRKIGLDECAMLGGQMEELADLLGLHSRCILRMMEFISRCGLPSAERRPDLKECQGFVSELIKATSASRSKEKILTCMSTE